MQLKNCDKENIPQEIIQKLRQMYLEVEGEIPFEIEVRQQILAVIEENGIEENKYTVANDILINSWVLENLKDKNLRDSAEVRKFIQDYFASKMEELKSLFSEESMWQIVNYRPEVIYNQEARQDEQVMMELYKKYTGESEVDFNLLDRTYLRNMLKIKEWMEKQEIKTRPPRAQYEYKGEKKILLGEAILGNNLSNIRCHLIKPYDQLETEEEREEYKRKNPEYEEVKAWIDELDENNVPIKEEQTYYINMLKIKEWMGAQEVKTKPPREQKKDEDGKKTVPEDEATLGKALQRIKSDLIKPYDELKTEEREEYKRQHPEYEEVKAWIDELDRNNVPIKEEQPYYINMLKIKAWMENPNRKIKTNPPRKQAKGRKVTVPEEESTLGFSLSRIRQQLIKPYEQLKTEKEKEEYKRQHPEYEDVKAWIDELDRNNVPIKEEQPHYINMLKIKAWMENPNRKIKTKPPREQRKDEDGKKTVSEDEATLGTALNNIRQRLIKPYEQLETDQEKEEYKRQHPEYEEVKAWIDELDRNNVPIKEEQTYYINMLKIKEWMGAQEVKTKPPRKQNKDEDGKKTVPEDEATLGKALSRIRSKLIKPYEQLETEVEKEEYKRMHPEYEEVKAWLDELDKNKPQNKTKRIISKKKQEETLDEALESGAVLESEIARIEKSVDERSTIDGETK